jgi:hypothetical protein
MMEDSNKKDYVSLQVTKLGSLYTLTEGFMVGMYSDMTAGMTMKFK